MLLIFNGADFVKNKRLFPNHTVPVISVDARQFPVATHFRYSWLSLYFDCHMMQQDDQSRQRSNHDGLQKGIADVV
jgi:HrpA-like RNA helicase